MKKYAKVLMLALFAVCLGAVKSFAGINISRLAPLIAGDNYALAQATQVVVSVQASPSAVQRGGASVVTATVQDQYGNPVAYMSVAFSIESGPGSLSAVYAATDASGRANVSFTAPSHFPGQSVQSRVRARVDMGLSPFYGETTITTTKK